MTTRRLDHYALRYVHYSLALLAFISLLCIIPARPAAAQAVSDSELYRRGYHAYSQGNWPDATVYLHAYVLRNPNRYRSDVRHRRQVDNALQYAEEQIHSALQCTAPVSSYYIISSDLLDPGPIVPSPSYPLVCRGGGNLAFDYITSSDLSDAPHIRIYFTKAGEGVGLYRENVAVLQPGQCSWLDRPISPDEPQQILIMNPLLNEHDFSIHWSSEAIARPGSALPYLSALQEKDLLQEFSVFNGTQGDFVATEIAPNPTNFPGSPVGIPTLAPP